MPSAIPYRRDRKRLAEELRILRHEAGLSGADLAGELGWTQSKVSKIETLKQLPTGEDITAWCAATGASGGVLESLRTTLRRARSENVVYKEQISEGSASALQADIGAFEASSDRIAYFMPTMIPGLLQTFDYATELLSLPCGLASLGADEDDIARTVTARMQRQQVLYDRRKTVQLVMLEGALRTRLVSAQTLAGQLDRLRALLGVPTVDIGIITFGSPVPVYPLSGFALLDDVVVIEWVSGEIQLSDPDEVHRYETYLQQLSEAAAHGEQAKQIINHVISELPQ